MHLKICMKICFKNLRIDLSKRIILPAKFLSSLIKKTFNYGISGGCSSYVQILVIRKLHVLFTKPFILDVIWNLVKYTLIVHIRYLIFWNTPSGHGELLELRLLEKSAQHDFIIARHHSSKWQKKWKMVDNQKISAVRVFRAVSLLDKKVSTARIALLDKVFENDNCSTQFIVKTMVYMYGS